MPANTIVIGGVAVGLSVAYHLAQRGISKVLLLERNQLSSGTSWHAAGIVQAGRQHESDPIHP